MTSTNVLSSKQILVSGVPEQAAARAAGMLAYGSAQEVISSIGSEPRLFWPDYLGAPSPGQSKQPLCGKSKNLFYPDVHC